MQLLPPERSDEFSALLETHYTSLFREVVYIHVLKRVETDFIDLTKFCVRHDLKMDQVTRICSVVVSELQALGWKTRLSYGDTGLFIFKDEVPNNCW